MQRTTHTDLLTARTYQADTVVSVTTYVLGAASARLLALRA